MENRNLSTARSLNKDNLDTLYEELRQEALYTCVKCFTRSQGLALFIRRGMAAWIEAWTNCIPSPLPVKKGEGNHLERNLAVDLHTEVAILLTNMTLRIYQEARTI